MATQILTLFDDDFFEQDKPELEKKAVPLPDKEPLVGENVLPEKVAEPVQPVPEAEPDVPGRELPIALHKEMPSMRPLPGKEELAAAKENFEQPEKPVLEKELNKQLLTELIQLDYTAFIHRELPGSPAPANMDREIGVGLNHKTDRSDTDSPEKKSIIAPEVIAEEAEPDDLTDDLVFEEVAPLPEWSLDKNYYSIGEVAHLFSVNTSHIRFWTNEFNLKPRTNRKGDRLYSPKDIAELRLIHHLVKEKKHTIKGAREKLKAGKDTVTQQLDLKEALVDLKGILTQIKEQL